jgi:hypothetical protein
LTKNLTTLRNECPFVAFFLAFSLLAIPSAQGSGLAQYRGPGVVIRYEPPMHDAAATVAAMYPRVKDELEAKIGWSVDFTPEVVLVRESRVFLQRGGSELVTAYAVPAQNLIVIDYAKMEKTPFYLGATLEHELCHLLVHRKISSNIPRWFDEGVAQWASGGIADIANPGEKDILKQAVLSHRMVALADLSSAFPSQSKELLLAYEESRSFIEYFVREYGAGKLRAVLQEMRDNKTLPEAFTKVLSADLNVFEEKWRVSLRRRYSWFIYASDHFYWLLFFAAALVTFIGYLRLRKRMKDYPDDGEEAEFSGSQDWQVNATRHGEHPRNCKKNRQQNR